ncbi:NADH dehydrogenase subunit J [Herbihabitans rhizosphaerae]|uniref:NADH-quinone oxidoreductase subunit J n=1 Tax=Herbihabitans rhizosphaerae TaxID=1872711 RepID=A0A4Q7L760_9PSEU|nr:NADH-quinone oxidoreductase subunit J [Herbihabitans rhizosphaerae]RZS44461.1 NADH dehydrogenase subunit J [Herbihabitans rhizosphaerae]
MSAVLAAAAAEVSTGEAIAFWVLGPVALAGALGMIFARNAVHSALWLVLTMLSLGVMYMVQQAPFLGFVQIIVYTGAVMMLFLFVLMLVGRDSSDSVVEVLRGQRLWATVLGIGIAGLIVGAVSRSLTDVPVENLQQQNAGGANVNNLGKSIFTEYLFPFELTSALLITAAMGAMVLGYLNRHEKGMKRTQKELVEARFRGEYERPSPLPGPGVFATANSVATPALLPDGSVAPESLSRLIDSTASETFSDEIKSVAGTEPGPDAHALTPSTKDTSTTDTKNTEDTEETR